MKKIINISILLIVSSLYIGCQDVSNPSPTQNEALNGVSNSNANKKNKGIMQNSLDSWLKEDWEKNTKGYDENQTKTEEVLVSKDKNTKKDEKGFLQYYVDKAFYYNKHKSKKEEKSHAKELEKLPVIGK